MQKQLEFAHAGHGGGDVLHNFLPKVSVIVKEMQDAGRFYSKVVTEHPYSERGSPHIRFFAATVRATEDTLAQKAGTGELTQPDLGKAEAITTLRATIKNTKFPELSA